MFFLECDVVAITKVVPGSACQPSESDWSRWRRWFNSRFSNRTATWNVSVSCCSSNIKWLTMTLIDRHNELLHLTTKQKNQMPSLPGLTAIFVTLVLCDPAYRTEHYSSFCPKVGCSILFQSSFTLVPKAVYFTKQSRNTPSVLEFRKHLSGGIYLLVSSVLYA